MTEGMEAGACFCDWGDPPELFERKQRAARKRHLCCECGSPIEIGERYDYVKGRWDGYWDEFKTCLPCARIRDDFCAPYTMLREHLLEVLDCDYLGGDEEEEDEEP